MRGYGMAALALLLLSSCAGTAHYVKAGAGEEEFQRTFAKCKAQAAMVPVQPGLLQTAVVAGATKDNCMRAEGWVRDPPCNPMWSIC